MNSHRSVFGAFTFVISAMALLYSPLLAVGQDNAQADPADSETPIIPALESFQGMWTIESMEMSGDKRMEKDLPARFREMKNTVEGKRMTVKRIDNTFVFELVIVEQSNPLKVDMLSTTRKGQKKLNKCIMKIDGDRLIMADGGDRDRPTSFKTLPRERVTVSIFKRVKPTSSKVKVDEK